MYPRVEYIYSQEGLIQLFKNEECNNPWCRLRWVLILYSLFFINKKKSRTREEDGGVNN